MRRFWDYSGLALAPVLLAGLTLAGEGKEPAKKEAKAGCGQHGTKIDFVDSPKEAAKQAKEEKKLVLVLHVSGDFEDPRFT